VRVAAVVHPLTVAPEMQEHLRRRCDALGHELVSWQETTPQDEGTGLAGAALAAGAELVVVAGGDGTVRAVATALAGTGAALGIVPTGTGNLLARNLSLPLHGSTALDVALSGVRRRIDLGCATADDDPPRHFVVMAGVGMDAAMIAGASARSKLRLGWFAYVLSGIRSLRQRPVPCTVVVDGGEPLHRVVRSVVAGNVGQLQGGLRLMPDAQPDDGVLDVAVLSPRGALGWLHLASRLVRRRNSGGRPLDRLQATHLEVRLSRPQRWEYDGEPAGRTTCLVVTVEPGALTVMVPR
jgi:diacylglycerol kinase family enzyme